MFKVIVYNQYGVPLGTGKAMTLTEAEILARKTARKMISLLPGAKWRIAKIERQTV